MNRLRRIASDEQCQMHPQAWIESQLLPKDTPLKRVVEDKGNGDEDQ